MEQVTFKLAFEEWLKFQQVEFSDNKIPVQYMD